MVQLLAQIYLMTNTQIIVITLSLMFNPTKNALKWIVQLDCLYIVLESVHLDGEQFWGDRGADFYMDKRYNEKVYQQYFFKLQFFVQITKFDQPRLKKCLSGSF